MADKNNAYLPWDYQLAHLSVQNHTFNSVQHCQFEAPWLDHFLFTHLSMRPPQPIHMVIEDL